MSHPKSRIDAPAGASRSPFGALFAAMFLAVSSVLMPTDGIAQVDEEQSQALTAFIDGLVAPGEPGIAVGIVTQDGVAYTHYAGLANLDVPTPIDARSRFNIASNAKQYTALMALDLANQGRIALSKDFRVYLPGAMPDVSAEISIHQLITHTSGVRDISELWGLTGVTWYERPMRNRDAMALLNRQVDLNFAPGTDYLYSNSNYILLAELISTVTDQPFHEYAAAFFEARGMSDTWWRRRYGVVVPNVARAYGKWSGWLEDPAMANTMGDGFLYTTLDDQLAWEQQVWGRNATLPANLIAISQGPIKGMATGSYGFGLELGSHKGLQTVSHIGSTGGYAAYVVRFPTEKTSVVVMGNTTQIGVVGVGLSVAERVLAGKFSAAATFPAGPDEVGARPDLADFVGLYELGGGTFVRLTLKDGELFREIVGRDPVRMIPEEGNVFRYETFPDLKLVLEKDDAGEPELALYSPNQAPQYGAFVPAAPAGDKYRRLLEGTFVNGETDTEIIVKHRSGDEFAMIKNGRERTLTLMGRDLLVWNAYRLRVMRPGPRRPANGLLVDNRRIRNVEFVRVD